MKRRILLPFLLIFLVWVPDFAQSKKLVNLAENFKITGITNTTLPGEPLITLSNENMEDATLSGDLKYLAYTTNHKLREEGSAEIRVVKLKNKKDFALVDTQQMKRYGRPRGYVYSLKFNDKNQLEATVGDANEGATDLVLDVEKKDVVSDKYTQEYYGDEGEDEGDYYFEEMYGAIKKVFPKLDEPGISRILENMFVVDTVGYLLQGISEADRSIYYLNRETNRLKLIHNVSPKVNVTISSVWGTSSCFFYILSDGNTKYLFQFSISRNTVVLLDKFSSVSAVYFNTFKMNNGETWVYFSQEEVADKERIRLFHYTEHQLVEILNYQSIDRLEQDIEKNMLFVYYHNNGKSLLDVRKL